MPHLSKQKPNKKTLGNLDRYLLAFLVETSAKTRKSVFREIFTKTERLMIAKRLAIVYCIAKGKATHEISRILKVSPSTVARFELAFETKQLGNTEKWVQDNLSGGAFLKLLGELLAIPFEARQKSLNQFMDENF